MNNPIFNDTLKVIETIRNSNGKLSPKNQFLHDLGDKALKLNIGCNFVTSLSFGKEYAYTATDKTLYSFEKSKEVLKLAELVNFFTCLSVTMTDRFFAVTYNNNHQIMIVCLPMAKFMTLDKILVRDKDAITERTDKVKNAISGEVKEITSQVGKGKRPINKDEISTLKTMFNKEYGINYNKVLVEVVKKSA